MLGFALRLRPNLLYLAVKKDVLPKLQLNNDFIQIIPVY